VSAQRKMRVQQLWHWIYVRGAQQFADMTSISKEMRQELEQHFTVARPEVAAEQISSDGTRKWLLRLSSGDKLEKAHEVECVYIPETDRGTLCVSSQVGCTLNCAFCHTGTQRLVRNLTAGEIVGQVMVARDRLNDWADRENGTRLVTNVVMMGMGEPLYNFEAVRDALLIVADNEGIGISRRRITLSTSGVVPNITRAGAEIGSMLAISLHAVTDEVRDQLVPLNRKYPIAELLEACRNYPGLSNARRITFEYVMLKGVNDSFADAKALASYVGLIPREYSSGARQRLGGVTKQGSPLLRFLWCEAGAHAVRRDPELKRFYRRKLVQKGLGKARVAVARKLGIRLWIMLRDEIDYEEFCRRGQKQQSGAACAGMLEVGNGANSHRPVD